MESHVPLQALLIEDSEDDEIMIRRLINGSGLNVNLQVERDGETALKSLQASLEASPDGADLPRFILLDLSLPRVDGIEVLRRLKTEPAFSDIPVIILSGTQDEEEIRLGQELRAHTHLVKPISLTELTWIVKSVENYWPRLEKLRLLQ